MTMTLQNFSHTAELTSIETPEHNTPAIGKVRSFFKEKISMILESKSCTFALASLVLVGAMELNSSQKTENTETVYQPTDFISITSTQNQDDNTKLGSVHFNGQNYIMNVNESLIQSQAKKYDLDPDILTKYIEENERNSLQFINYLPQSEYNNQINKYSYQQLSEAIQDLASLEFLITQQAKSEKDKIESQRIFNEKLRSKQKVAFLGSKTIQESTKYDLILAAAAYSYQFVFGENYYDDAQSSGANQESMKNVTKKIDAGAYDENALIMYANELKRTIEVETGFNIDAYKTHLASVNYDDVFAHNNSVEKRED